VSACAGLVIARLMQGKGGVFSSWGRTGILEKLHINIEEIGWGLGRAQEN
jgi:hypothetical protein